MNTIQQARLRDAMDWSNKQLQPFRNHRHDAVREYVGSYYGSRGGDNVPINLVWMAISIYQRGLAARAPKVMVKTSNQALTGNAFLFENALNMLIPEIMYAQTLKAVVLDALFSCGITKTASYNVGKVEIGGRFHDVGQPFCDRVSLDHFVIDMNARTFEEAGYIGDRQRRTVRNLMESGLYTEEKVRQLVGSSIISTTHSGDEERVETIAIEKAGDDAFLEAMVEYWDVYIPYDNMMVTVAGGEGMQVGEVIDERPWEGPEFGPYRMLSFGHVPDNVMPISPISCLMPTHKAINRVQNKVIEDAVTGKTVYGVPDGGEQDADRVKNALNQELVKMTNPANVVRMDFAGANPVSVAIVAMLRETGVWMGGNLDALGGLSPQSDTATQDSMLMRAASALAADMLAEVHTFGKGNAEDLAWHLWADPLRSMDMIHRIPGTSIDIPMHWGADTREGDFLDYNFDIIPYSTVETSPEQEWDKMMRAIERIAGPFYPLMQAQGISLDFQRLFRLTGRRLSIEDLEQVLTYVQPIPLEAGAQDIKPTDPNKPNGQYTRTNRLGGTRRGMDAMLSKVMMGAGNQQESGAIGRSMG